MPLLLLIPIKTMAVCPVCTVAVGAGVGMSRWLGIDDIISGLWVGGLIISTALWTSSWLEGKNLHLQYQKTMLILSFYALSVLPLYWSGVIGHPDNVFLGLDRLLFGTIVGSVLFLLSLNLDKYLRARNGGNKLFSYQKIVIPISFLLIGSLIFCLVIN